MPRVHRGRRCFVKTCNHYQRDLSKVEDLKFFSVPDDPVIREEFKKLCGRSGETAKFSVICSRHFLDSDLTKTGHLRRGALPSMNLINDDPEAEKTPPKSGKKWKGNLCVVHGCRSYTGERNTYNLHFFYCPQRNLSEQSEEAMELYNRWFDACGRTDIEQFSKYHRVCSLHFEPDEIDLDTNRAKLRATAYPTRNLPGSLDDPLTYDENGHIRSSPDVQSALLQRLDKCCKEQWRIVRSTLFKPPMPMDGLCGWTVLEKEETHVTFCRVRKGSSQLMYNATVDFIRYEADMTVILSTGASVIPQEKYAEFLDEGRASNHQQVANMFNFDFAPCESLLVVSSVGPISFVDQALLVSLGNNVFETEDMQEEGEPQEGEDAQQEIQEQEETVGDGEAVQMETQADGEEVPNEAEEEMEVEATQEETETETHQEEEITELQPEHDGGVEVELEQTVEEQHEPTPPPALSRRRGRKAPITRNVKTEQL